MYLGGVVRVLQIGDNQFVANILSSNLSGTIADTANNAFADLMQDPDALSEIAAYTGNLDESGIMTHRNLQQMANHGWCAIKGQKAQSEMKKLCNKLEIGVLFESNEDSVWIIAYNPDVVEDVVSIDHTSDDKYVAMLKSQGYKKITSPYLICVVD